MRPVSFPLLVHVQELYYCFLSMRLTECAEMYQTYRNIVYGNCWSGGHLAACLNS